MFTRGVRAVCGFLRLPSPSSGREFPGAAPICVVTESSARKASAVPRGTAWVEDLGGPTVSLVGSAG